MKLQFSLKQPCTDSKWSLQATKCSGKNITSFTEARSLLRHCQYLKQINKGGHYYQCSSFWLCYTHFSPVIQTADYFGCDRTSNKKCSPVIAVNPGAGIHFPAIVNKLKFKKTLRLFLWPFFVCLRSSHSHLAVNIKTTSKCCAITGVILFLRNI